MVRFVLFLLFTGGFLSLCAFESTAQSLPVPTPSPLSGASQNAPEASELVKSSTSSKKQENRIYQAACPILLNGLIKAKKIPPVSEGECGERSPLEVTGFASFRLSSPATLNCRMATQIAGWVEEVDAAARKHLGSGLSTIISSTSYLCRRRNNAPDGKISEHGFANALDVTGFKLQDGKTVTILDNWGPIGDGTASEITQEGEFLRQIRDQACKRFTTILGPESDTHHRDHLHLDLGCHGRTCTHVICE